MKKESLSFVDVFDLVVLFFFFFFFLICLKPGNLDLDKLPFLLPVLLTSFRE